jgi:uncharacterized protein
MKGLFTNKVKVLETNIDAFLDEVCKAGLILVEGIKAYIRKNPERFEQCYKEISTLESRADTLRRDIKQKLYSNMLIPESRGDVLGLLETIDTVVDICEKVLEQLSIEQPIIPDGLEQDFIELSELSGKAVDSVVQGSRAFFTNIKMVNDFVNKVHFYEHEADQVEKNIKRKAFASEEIKQFSRKVHIRYFAEKVALVSDVAESVAERLAVYAIKRRM